MDMRNSIGMERMCVKILATHKLHIISYIYISRLTDTRWDKGQAVIKGGGKAVIAAIEASVNDARQESNVK